MASILREIDFSLDSRTVLLTVNRRQEFFGHLEPNSFVSAEKLF
jgi:hypothetical protein